MKCKSFLPQDLFFSRTSDYLQEFLIQQCNRSIKTSVSYQDALTVFKRYVISCGKNILTFRYADCTYAFLLDFKEYLAREMHYEPSSINQRLAAIKSYIKYSYGCDPSLLQVYISVAAVPFSSVPRVQQEIASEEDIAFLLSMPPASKKGLRDTLIMSILFDAAIRLDELVQLAVGDIYHKDDITYLLIHGKGNKERKVSLDERTVALLNVYLQEYHPGIREAGKPLIYTMISGKTKPMSHRNIQKMIKKYAAQAREAGRNMPPVHPHFLRRSRASNLYQNGTPIEIVSRFLGHSSVETTKDHYAYPSLDQMRKAMEAGTKPAGKEQPLWVGHEDELARLCGLR